MDPVLVVASLTVLWWSRHATDLMIGPSGVRVRWLRTTRTIRWEEISGFRFGNDDPSYDSLSIDLLAGHTVRTPVRRTSRRWLGWRPEAAVWLPPQAAHELLRDLDCARSLWTTQDPPRTWSEVGRPSADRARTPKDGGPGNGS
jgi:hypothetical protein